MSRVVLMGIAGASGSGKTLLAANLADRLGTDRAAIIPEDAYYRDLSHVPLPERAVQNFDHPDAFEHELLVTHLRKLLDRERVSLPTYDYKTHCRRREFRVVEPHPVVLLEGIMVLSVPQLRDLMDVCVFVDTPLDICLARRIERDLSERGRSLESVVRQFRETVRPSYVQFIEPSKHHADILVPRGGRNQVAIDLLASRLNDMLWRAET